VNPSVGKRKAENKIENQTGGGKSQPITRLPITKTHAPYLRRERLSKKKKMNQRAAGKRERILSRKEKSSYSKFKERGQLCGTG